MSFSGTPLGQGRRLDHQSFLNGVPPAHLQPQNTTSPPRKVPSNSSIPLSYAYGAPTLSNRSPGKPSSPSLSPRAQRKASPTRPNNSSQLQIGAEEGEAEEEERALARYARLKQRNQVLANRPGSSLGPGIITSPPKPNGTSLKDTSVNIASAFHQAANSFNMSTGTNANSSWAAAGSRQNLPRSTSVEYEAQAQSTSHRRLAVPPNRAGSRSNLKPPQSKSSRSTGNISDMENNHGGEAVDANGRGKSPFDQLAEFTKRAALAPAAFLMRQRSQEPDDLPPPSRQATDVTLVGRNNNSVSYDYAEEEEEYQKSLKATSKSTTSNAHKRNRMSMDNRAYRPSTSDVDSDSDDDADDDGRKGRKRRAKKGLSGGPLTSLPVAGYDRKKRRTRRSGKTGEDDASHSDEHASDQRSGRSNTPAQNRASEPRGSVPPSRAASVLRTSVPPESRSFDRSGPTDTSVDIEHGLHPISETDEMDTDLPLEADTSREDAHRQMTPAPRLRPAFSIGAFCGKIVHHSYLFVHSVGLLALKVLAMITLLVGRVLGSFFNLLVRQPVRFFHRRRVPIAHLGKYVVVAFGMYMAWYALRHPALLRLSTGGIPSQSMPVYQAADLPAGTIEELSARLLKAENTLANLQASSQSSQSRYELDLRKQGDIAGRVSRLESRIEKEAIRAQKSEEDYRLAASHTVESLQRQIRTLQSQIDDAAHGSSGTTNDEDARAKLRVLEDRLGGMEGTVKEAIELSRTAAKVGAAAAAPAWWNKMASGTGTSGITIKSSDGQDVTSLIGQIVDNAIAKHTKDDLARVDYALYSGGGKVIPALTSPTMEITPETKGGYLYSLFNNAPVQMGRAPVWALQHDTRVGHCWPFSGSTGQLGISLASPVYISDITIDHVAREVAHDLRTAPREMEVWGLVDGAENIAKYKDYVAQRAAAKQEAEEKGLPIPEDDVPPPSLRFGGGKYMRVASFKYDVRSPQNIQNFPARQEIKDLGMDFGLVVLAIKNNWGSHYTCLYRVRVHGTRLVEIPPIPDDL